MMTAIKTHVSRNLGDLGPQIWELSILQLPIMIVIHKLGVRPSPLLTHHGAILLISILLMITFLKMSAFYRP